MIGSLARMIRALGRPAPSTKGARMAATVAQRMKASVNGATSAPVNRPKMRFSEKSNGESAMATMAKPRRWEGLSNVYGRPALAARAARHPSLAACLSGAGPATQSRAGRAPATPVTLQQQRS
jgi:hypothetical protein